jgi:hypothetical protein
MIFDKTAGNYDMTHYYRSQSFTIDGHQSFISFTLARHRSAIKTITKPTPSPPTPARTSHHLTMHILSQFYCFACYSPASWKSQLRIDFRMKSYWVRQPGYLRLATGDDYSWRIHSFYRLTRHYRRSNFARRCAAAHHDVAAFISICHSIVPAIFHTYDFPAQTPLRAILTRQLFTMILKNTPPLIWVYADHSLVTKFQYHLHARQSNGYYPDARELN